MTNDERPTTNDDPLVRVVELTKHFPIRQGLLFQRVTGQVQAVDCLLYTSPSPRDGLLSRMPSSA